MNLFRDYKSSELIPYKKDYDPLLADLTLQYGIEPNIENQWKEIINISDAKLAKSKIDLLIKQLEKNSIKNGFFTSKDKVKIDIFHGFTIDDKDLYYLFFNVLKQTYSKLKEQGKNNFDGLAIFGAIKATLNIYFGEDVHNAKFKRQNLTSIVADENDNFIPPSIKVLKNSGCGLCVEKASVAHNLWLLCGKKSYFITSKYVQVVNVSKEFANDGHAFCLVEYDNKFRIFDAALNNFGILENNPIEDIKNGKQFEINNKNTNVVYVLKTDNNLNK